MTRFAVFMFSVAVAACASEAPASPSEQLPAMDAAGAAASGDSSEAGAQPAERGGGIPCDVYNALEHACHICHGAVPTNGAPMPLVEIADFRVLSVQSKPKIPKSELALMRIDGRRGPPMPPANFPITAEDKQTLIDWLSDGAPEAEGPCQ